MKRIDTLILGREDLSREHRYIDFEKVQCRHLIYDAYNKLVLETLVLFMDTSGNIKILKNRWGKDGITVLNNKETRWTTKSIRSIKRTVRSDGWTTTPPSLNC